MATEPNWHRVDEEIQQILADNPDLVDELDEFDRATTAERPSWSRTTKSGAASRRWA